MSKGTVMPINPHKGKLIETVVLKYPDFIRWLGSQPWNANFQWLYDLIEELKEKFDEKPLINASCAGRSCGKSCSRRPTRFTLYSGSWEAVFWCPDCDPLQGGANETKITIVNTYDDAVFHAWRFDLPRLSYRKLIRQLAEVKGLTGNFTDKNVLAFFYGEGGV